MSALRSLAYSLIFYIGGGILAFANEGPNNLFYQGNTAYSHGCYQEAIQAYEAILPYGESPELYFNLQEAYLQEGLISQAILVYERLNLLAPYSKLRAPAFEKIRPYYQNPQWTLAQRLARLFPSPNGWSWALSVSFWGLVASAVGVWLNRPRKRIYDYLLIVSLGGLICSGVAYWGWQAYQKVGIILNLTPLKLAPTPQSPYLETLPLGTWVQFEKKAEGYSLVVAPEGQKGWVSEQELEWLIARNAD